jgi:hypothetical protein
LFQKETFEIQNHYFLITMFCFVLTFSFWPTNILACFVQHLFVLT